MTDNEIIKALLCHESWSNGCDSCPLTMGKACGMVLARGALHLINRQKAEIERLQDEVKEKTETITFLKDQSIGWSIDFCNLKAKLNTAKTEAIKEFADRLCADRVSNDPVVIAAKCLLKEMTEGKDDGEL